MLGYPILDVEGNPEGVDAEGADRVDGPLDTLEKQADALAVDGQGTTVDNGILFEPRLVPYQREGKADAEGADADERYGDVHADELEDVTFKFGLHNKSPLW